MIVPVHRWTSVFVLLLSACGSSELPLASIVSVTPQRVSASECVLLTVQLDRPLPVRLDYGKDSAELVDLTRVSIAERDIPVLSIEDQGRRLVTDVSAGLAQGTHDVRLTLKDGQQVVLPDALEVTAPLVLETFRFDPIVNQLRHEPFTMTIRASGQDAALFHGRVRLRSNRGHLQPTWSAPFVNGVLTQQVTIDDTGGNNVFIEMTDCAGRTVNSNEFRLDARGP
jgi:hypothetical protein